MKDLVERLKCLANQEIYLHRLCATFLCASDRNHALPLMEMENAETVSFENKPVYGFKFFLSSWWLY